MRVEGNIDQKMYVGCECRADSIARGLQKSWPYQPSALMVTINSPGGSVVQAKTIADLLKLYSNRYKYFLSHAASPLPASSKISALEPHTLCFLPLPRHTRVFPDQLRPVLDDGRHWSQLENLVVRPLRQQVRRQAGVRLRRRQQSQVQFLRAHQRGQLEVDGQSTGRHRPRTQDSHHR